MNLISARQLADELARDDARWRVLDASFYLPDSGRDARAEFVDAHIPGAVFFDVDAIADPGSDLPHMFPSPAQFAEAMSALGIGSDDRVVCYQSGGPGGAYRAWWMLRAFGHRDVMVLDGGLAAWTALGGDLASGEPTIAPAEYRVPPAADALVDLAAMRQIVDEGAMQVLDARPAGRFNGSQPEPRAGLRSGHMPGALNVPAPELFGEGGAMHDRARLRRVFESAGVDLRRPVVASCGSGVSACVLLHALDSLGHPALSLYDGSWSEWGARDDVPVVC